MEIYIGTYDGAVSILHASVAHIRPFLNFKLSSNSIKAIALVSNNNYLVAGGYDQELKVIDLNEYNEKIEAKENSGQITSICSTGKQLFFIGVGDGTIRQWDCAQWGISKQSRHHKKVVSHMVVDPSGKLLMSVAGNKLVIWAAKTLTMAHEYKFAADECLQHLAISKDLQKVFLSNSKGELKMINTSNNKITLIFKVQVPRKIQTFIYWEGFILVGTDKGEVMAWKIQSEDDSEQKQSFEHKVWFQAHDNRIKQMKIVFGDYLILATAGGQVSIWDFPQFLASVESVSQDYNLEGLQPLCSYDIKSRILCMEVKQMGDVVSSTSVQTPVSDNTAKKQPAEQKGKEEKPKTKNIKKQRKPQKAKGGAGKPKSLPK